MLNVFYDGQTVGRLWDENRTLRFQYEDTWRQGGGFELSPRLSLAAEVFSGDEVHCFFANLLPEGRVLQALLKLRRLPEGDVFRQLEAFGEDAAGAFRIAPEGQGGVAEADYQPYPEEEIRRDIDRLKDNLPLLDQHRGLRLSLAGAQNKLPVKFESGSFWLPRGGAASTHILKPGIHPMARYPHGALNEALCLGLAARCGLGAVGVQVVDLGEPVLVITRYDRVRGSGGVRRLHQLDFCQFAGVLPDQKYEQSGGPDLARVFDLINRHSAAPGPDRLRLLDWVVFNVLIGNADAHAKNLAMVVGQGGGVKQGWRLAPFYDLLCTAIYPDLDTKLALSVGGEFRPDYLVARHWQRFAQDVGVNFSQFRKRATALTRRLAQALTPAAQELGLTEEHDLVVRLSNLMQKRSAQLIMAMSADKGDGAD